MVATTGSHGLQPWLHSFAAPRLKRSSKRMLWLRRRRAKSLCLLTTSQKVLIGTKEVSMRIGVTGASGQLGMGVVRHLLARASASDIVAITRTPEKLAAFSAQGVNVRTGDFNDRAGLEKAFSGVERVLIIPGSDLTPNVRPAQHRTA